MVKVIVDRDLCVGHGLCEALAPDLFEVGDDGTAHLLREDIPAAHADRAVAACPSRALRIEPTVYDDR